MNPGSVFDTCTCHSRSGKIIWKYLMATAALVAVGSSGLCAASWNPKKPKELLRKKDYSSASRIVAADTSALHGADLWEALLLLAELETDISRTEELYRRVIAEGPSTQAARAALNLALISYAQGDYVSTVELLTTNHGELPQSELPRATFFLAMSWKQLGDLDKARNALGRLSQGECWEWSQIALAEIELEDGKINRAMEFYERAANTQVAPVARFGLAECHERLGEKELAEQEYRSIASSYPNSFEALKAMEKIAMISRSKGRETKDSESPGQRIPEAKKEEESRAYSFTLQFGAYENRDNALSSADKLRAVLPAVRVERVELEGRVWYRVRAGIYRSRRGAEQDLARAREKLGTSGTVVPLK